MVSEDSDQLGSGFPVVHRFSDLRDLDQTLSSQVSPGLDRVHALSELLEV
jgi:hypothetical protein